MADQPQQQSAETPKKPLQKSVGLYVILGFILVIMLISVILSMYKTAPAEVKQVTAPTDQPVIAAFPAQVQTTADTMRTAAAKVQETAAAMRAAVGALPPCNSDTRTKLAAAHHQYWTVAATATTPVMHFVCQDDNNWAPMPIAVDDIQPPTQEQERADQRYQQRGGNGSGSGESRADKRKAEREAALESSAIAFWHSDKPASPPKSAEEQALADKQKEVADTQASILAVQQGRPAPGGEAAGAVKAEGDEAEDAAAKEKSKYDWDAYTGQLYRVFEGNFIETILANRLQGEFTGPVNVMLTTNVYSHDNQHILMPQGTRILGTASKVSGGNQRRLQVVFQRILMPDGYSVDIEKFAGLDQQGGTGLTGRVDTHWKKLVGIAVLVGAIEGLSQLSNVSSGGSVVQIQSGMSQSTGQEGLQILRNAMNTLPTVTVYEGTRVRIWVKHDLMLPAYENHTVIPNL